MNGHDDALSDPFTTLLHTSVFHQNFKSQKANWRQGKKKKPQDTINR